MTTLAVYTRPDLALLATDTYNETRALVTDVAPPEWPLLTTGTVAKLEWCSAGWFAGTGVGSLAYAIADALRALPTFAEASHVVREVGERWLREWEEKSPELAAHVCRDRHHTFMLGIAPEGPTARVLDWHGDDAIAVPHGRAAGSGPPGRIQRLLPGLLQRYTRTLENADLDAAVRATATYLGAAVEACGPDGGISTELEMGLFVRGEPYYLPPTSWQLVASGEVQAVPVGPEGPQRVIVRREQDLAARQAARGERVRTGVAAISCEGFRAR